MVNKYKKTENSFKGILWKAGFTDQSIKGQKKIAEYLQVSDRTIRRWMLNNSPSKHALNKLENRDRTLNKHWDKFKIVNNVIHTPNGYEYTNRDLEKLALEIERLKALYS